MSLDLLSSRFGHQSLDAWAGYVDVLDLAEDGRVVLRPFSAWSLAGQSRLARTTRQHPNGPSKSLGPLGMLRCIGKDAPAQAVEQRTGSWQLSAKLAKQTAMLLWCLRCCCDV
jgi:hypothetical protein